MQTSFLFSKKKQPLFLGAIHVPESFFPTYKHNHKQIGIGIGQTNCIIGERKRELVLCTAIDSMSPKISEWVTFNQHSDTDTAIIKKHKLLIA